MRLHKSKGESHSANRRRIKMLSDFNWCPPHFPFINFPMHCTLSQNKRKTLSNVLLSCCSFEYATCHSLTIVFHCLWIFILISLRMLQQSINFQRANLISLLSEFKLQSFFTRILCSRTFFVRKNKWAKKKEREGERNGSMKNGAC